MEYVETTRLTKEECAFLEKIGTVITIPQKNLIYLKGEKADCLYYIKNGRVRIFDSMPSGREITVNVLEAGHIFGESAFGSAQRPINVQAVNQVVLIAVSIKRLTEYFGTYPTLALHLLQMCTDSMDRLTNRVEEQCLLDRYGKLACYLLEVTNVESAEKGTIGGIVPYTHEDLGYYVGLNRTTVTAVLKYFEKKHWISCGYGRLRVIDRDSLNEFVEKQKNGIVD